MRIVFVSNYFNHHQKPFCEEMRRRLGSCFAFVSTSTMRAERKELGYSQEIAPDYVLLSYQDEQQKKEALSLINDADVVIAGSAPEEMLGERIRKGKLLLRYSERPFKKKIGVLRKTYHALRFRKLNRFKTNIYMMCASAYAAYDYASIGMYKERMYKWGYFPLMREYDIDSLLSKKETNVLMWCGRFLNWKHPENAIALAAKLKKNGYDFRLDIIGTGEMEKELRCSVAELGLEENVRFLGAMPPDQVRLHMERAGIYLFTSDRQEGWGAVLNESMNSGCAVVAGHAIGSVPFLIKDGENGCVYPSDNVDTLFHKVKVLLDHPELQAVYGRAAYQTIVNEWNAQAAVERLLQLCESILKNGGYPALFKTGPCSRATVVKEKSYRM